MTRHHPSVVSHCEECGFEFVDREERFSDRDGQVVCHTCADDQGLIYNDPRDPMFDEDFLIDGVGFANPGGNSALRAETETNPRNLPCPTCDRPNMLTPLDQMHGYQCDRCADAAERGGP